MMNSFWMILSSFFYATYALFLKFASIDGLTSFEILFYRSLLGIIFISIVMLHKSIGFLTKHPFEHACRSCIGTSCIVFGAIAISGINLGMAQTLNNMTPLFIGLFVCIGCLRAREPFPWGLVASLILGFIGVTIMVGPSASLEEMPFVLVGLLSAFTGGVAMMFIPILSRLREPEERILFYFFLAGLVCGAIGILFTGGIHIKSLSTVGWILGFSFSSTLMQVCFTMAFARGDTGFSGFLQYLTIPFAVIFGVIFLGESLSFAAIAGMCVIAGAGILASLFTARRKKKA
ncbi:MAG TPA: EamA/RhaT family transporter [Sutterella sp.]|nr:EamA/RhaT family transporter [Sutterella sp.]